MKILVVTQLYPLSSDDPVNSFALHYLVREWAKSNKVKVLRLHYPYEKGDKPASKNFELDGVEVTVVSPVWLPGIKVSFVDAAKAVEQLQFKPDVMVAHLYNAYLNFSAYTEREKIPLVAGIHKSDIKKLGNFFHGRRIQKALKRADGIAFRSMPLQERFNQIVGVPEQPVFIANSGVPDHLTRYAESLLPLKESKGNQKRKLISVCQLIPLKQIDVVLKSLKKLLDEGISNWEYTVVGDGPELSKLKGIAQEPGLAERVVFRGRLSRKEVFDAMKSHGTFIMPSYNETFGLVFLEAMACGCVVIGAEGWGIDGIVQHGVNGFLCDPYDSSSIVANLRMALIASESDLAEVKEASLKTAVNFSEQKAASDYLSFLNRIGNANKQETRKN